SVQNSSTSTTALAITLLISEPLSPLMSRSPGGNSSTGAVVVVSPGPSGSLGSMPITSGSRTGPDPAAPPDRSTPHAANSTASAVTAIDILTAMDRGEGSSGKVCSRFGGADGQGLVSRCIPSCPVDGDARGDSGSDD